MKSWTPGDERFVKEGMVKVPNEGESGRMKTEMVFITGNMNV